MGLDTLYASKVEEGIKRWTDNPGPAGGPSSFGAWSFLAAGAKGPVAGGLESAGSTADFLSLFAAPAAATFGAMDTSGAVDQKGVEAARQKMLASDSFDPAAGDALRRKADTFLPDPQTASHADQVVAGLTRGVAKAAVDITTMGLVPGAVAFGVDEGNNAGQRLRMEGVDTATATKVGAVTAVANAAGALIPMGGSTIAKTVGLAAVAGPGTYMAQEAMSRKILADAGYKDQASLHNPLDPLGLTLSTVIPFGFGALHYRGTVKRAGAVEAGSVPLEQMTLAERQGLKYDSPTLDAYATKVAEANGVPPAVLLAVKNAGEKSGSTQVSPKGAQGVMQFMPATAKEVGITDPRDPMQSIAGGAVYLRKLYDAYGSWDAAVAHYNGGGSQAALVRGGGKPSFPETAKYLERVQAYIEDHAVKAGSADPAVVDAARVKVTQAALHENLPDFPTAHAEVLHASDELAAGRFPEVREVPPTATREFKEWFGDSKVVDETGAPMVVYHGTDKNFSEFRSGDGIETLGFPDKQGHYLTPDVEYAHDYGSTIVPAYVSMKNPYHAPADGFEHTYISPKRRAELEAMGHDGVMFPGSKDGTFRPEVVAFDPKQIKSAIGNSGKFDRTSASLTDPLRPGERNPRQVTQPASEGKNALPDSRSPTIEQAAPKIAADTSSKGPASIDSQRVAAIAETDPGLKVVLPGSTEAITVREALERAKATAKEEGDYAQLIKAAAECALSFGA